MKRQITEKRKTAIQSHIKQVEMTEITLEMKIGSPKLKVKNYAGIYDFWKVIVRFVTVQ